MLQNPDSIHVVYASDEHFAPVLGVSIASLLITGKDIPSFDITVFDGGLSSDNRQKIDDLCRQFGRNPPEYLCLDDMEDLLGDRIGLDRGSIMQYARLFIGRLPYERVLYLDCDVMLRRSVSELWSKDLEGKTVAAMPDVFSRLYRKGMELNPEEPIYNDGVMLIDLKKWREHNVEQKALDYIHCCSTGPLQDDLGVMNAVLSCETLALSPEWNSLTAFYDFTYDEMLYYRKPPAYFPKEVISHAIQDPALVHFTSSFRSVRPWEAGCTHPYAKEYEDLRALTPWADLPLRQPHKGLSSRLMNALPWSLAIHIAAPLQAYGRPLLYLVRERVHKFG